MLNVNSLRCGRNALNLFALLLMLPGSAPLMAFSPTPQGELPKAPAMDVHTRHFLPLPENLAPPSELPFLTDMVRQLSLVDGDKPVAIIEILDASLQRLNEPTQLRGFVQFLRAQSLVAENKGPAAIEAIEDSIRLLPGYSGPLITAASVYAYADRPQQAADYLIRASNDDPDSTREIDSYEISNLIHRLRAVGDNRRLGLLSDRLIEIKWLGSDLGSRSALVRDAIEHHMADDDIVGARKLVPNLILPAHSRDLLAELAYQPIWADIEQWAGPILDRQWGIYLREARSRWTASKDPETMSDYIDALVAAGHDDTLLREFLPLFLAKLDERKDEPLLFEVSKVAAALGRKGRWAEADALLEHAQQTWSLEGSANALNIAANRARYLLMAGRFQESLAKMDEAIAAARKWGPEVNFDALAAMHHYRACALHRLGRGGEMGVSMGIALAGEHAGAVANLYLCMSDLRAARNVLLKGLKIEPNRKSVIDFMQQPDSKPFQSPFAIALYKEGESLRRDPAILAALALYGRVLPYPPNDGAPPE